VVDALAPAEAPAAHSEQLASVAASALCSRLGAGDVPMPGATVSARVVRVTKLNDASVSPPSRSLRVMISLPFQETAPARVRVDQ
jgi:hypothetical protein